MRSEEDTLIPLARRHLTAQDWEEINAAFTGHSDPLFGATIHDEYEDMFRKIRQARAAPRRRRARARLTRRWAGARAPKPRQRDRCAHGVGGT